jgi:hypothetical protein
MNKALRMGVLSGLAALAASYIVLNRTSLDDPVNNSSIKINSIIEDADVSGQTFTNVPGLFVSFESSKIFGSITPKSKITLQQYPLGANAYSNPLESASFERISPGNWKIVHSSPLSQTGRIYKISKEGSNGTLDRLYEEAISK